MMDRDFSDGPLDFSEFRPQSTPTHPATILAPTTELGITVIRYTVVFAFNNTLVYKELLYLV
jgi:hypothetical protein